MPYSQKKSKGRKTPSVKKSQKNPKRKSQKKSKRKSPSVGSVRKGHLGRPSAEQTLSNHNEKRNYAGTQSYISINEDQLRAIKKLMNDSCDKKNEKKLINKFPEFFKSEICKEIRFGFEYSKLNTFPKFVDGKVKESTEFNNGQKVFVSKLRPFADILYKKEEGQAKEKYFKRRIVNALNKLEETLEKNLKIQNAPKKVSPKFRTINVRRPSLKKISNTISPSDRNSNSSTNYGYNTSFSNNNSNNNLNNNSNTSSRTSKCDMSSFCKGDIDQDSESIVNIVNRELQKCANKNKKYNLKSLKTAVANKLYKTNN